MPSSVDTANSLQCSFVERIMPGRVVSILSDEALRTDLT
jgi:hypothetical protein